MYNCPKCKAKNSLLFMDCSWNFDSSYGYYICEVCEEEFTMKEIEK